MFDNTVTRFQSTGSEAGGFSNVRDTSFLSDLPIGDWTRYHDYDNDFDQYVAADFALAAQSTGAATAALTAGDGGLLLLTNTAANNDVASLQKTPASFTYAAGLPLWTHFRQKVDNVLGRLIIGMLNLQGAAPGAFTAANRTDGFYMLSDATGAVTVEYAVGGVRVVSAQVAQLVSNQFFDFRTVWDGACYGVAPQGRLYYELVGPGVTASVRGVITLPAGTAFPGATALAPILALQNGSAVARVVTFDREMAFKCRVNPNSTPAF